MKKSEILISAPLYEYILSASLREHKVLRALREETARDPLSIMQIPPEQGQFMALLLKLMGARKTLEIGTYTGYSALSAALAMPDDSLTVSCDINEDWSKIAQQYWQEAGVADKIDLRMGPALETLEKLSSEGEDATFDFVFIDADKRAYDGYYEGALRLLRAGGLIAIDNVFLFGSVVDSALMSDAMKPHISDVDTNVMRALNEKIRHDERVDLSMLPVGDGLTLVRKK